MAFMGAGFTIFYTIASFIVYLRGSEEMMSLDDEISSLQKENNHSDSQLHRIKADVAGMETEANGEDKVSVTEELERS